MNKQAFFNAALRRVADQVNAIIHSQNLHLVATGERYINAHVCEGAVLVEPLYGGGCRKFVNGEFRNGRGQIVNL